MSRSISTRLAAWGAILWVLSAVCVITVDSPAARFEASRVPGDLRRLVQLSEVFAHGLSVCAILVTIFVLDRRRRLFVPRIACVAFLSGILANVSKLLVARVRPAAFDLAATANESFLHIPGSLSSWELQSFPSGHTATAVGLALALGRVYPRGRWVFAIWAVFAASQRVLFDAHFVSDVLAGAGIACLVTAVLGDRLLWDARYWRAS